jgi:hypothetical protein
MTTGKHYNRLKKLNFRTFITILIVYLILAIGSIGVTWFVAFPRLSDYEQLDTSKSIIFELIRSDFTKIAYWQFFWAMMTLTVSFVHLRTILSVKKVLFEDSNTSKHETSFDKT